MNEDCYVLLSSTVLRYAYIKSNKEYFYKFKLDLFALIKSLNNIKYYSIILY